MRPRAASCEATFTELLAQARSGSRTAFDELFERWRPLLWLQARRLLGPELAARVDPAVVVQETCTGAGETLAPFPGQTEAEWVAWLRGILVNRTARLRQRLGASPEPHREVETPPSAPKSAAIDLEVAARLARAVESLPPDLRELVLRRIFDREPFESLARSIGPAPAALRVLWTRALKSLRTLLEVTP